MERAARIAAIGTPYRHHPGLPAFGCALLAGFASAGLEGIFHLSQP